VAAQAFFLADPGKRNAVKEVRSARPFGEAGPAAVAFLQDRLADGACRRQDLVAQAAEAGISFRTLERGKARLGVPIEARARRRAESVVLALADRRRADGTAAEPRLS
jgi:hypothetical protein